MKKVLTVIGARPQFIKASVVSSAFAQAADVIEVVVHTGQHYDFNMSDVFFIEMGMRAPGHHLGVGGATHGAMTGRQLEKLEQVLLVERPEIVLVYGDTNSTLAGALAAAKLNIPVAHVEAGLRSFNRQMPEEVNRVLADHLAEMLFAPTTSAQKNLLAEGILPSRIEVVGDVMYDVSLFYRHFAKEPCWFSGLGVAVGEYVLCTIHRAENTGAGEKLRSILDGLARCGRQVILPLHPRTRSSLQEFGIRVPPNVYVVDPVGYLEMSWLEANCRLVATDSGGVQKEAYFFEKYCVTLRSETEWVELVERGVNVLVGCDANRISSEIQDAPAILAYSGSLFGDGTAAAQIVRRILAGIE